MAVNVLTSVRTSFKQPGSHHANSGTKREEETNNSTVVLYLCYIVFYMVFTAIKMSEGARSGSTTNEYLLSFSSLTSEGKK